MLYKHRKEKFDDKKFQKPSSEYRSMPFWAWNGNLEKNEMLTQIDEFKKMGFGGFHMHVRTGLNLPYLGDDHMDMIKTCVDEAKKKKMLACLYDEDRWPSGFAGGFVTKDHPEFRQKKMILRTEKAENPYKYCGKFDIVLNEDGTLKSYKLIQEDEEAEGNAWFAQIETIVATPRFNNATYSDTMNKKATEAFLKITHEKYYENVGNEFGKIIPSMFTDEPQFARESIPDDPFSLDKRSIPWTADLEETYALAYDGESLFSHLPELLWDLPDGKLSAVRYRYFNHITDRFVNGFSKPIGQWCKDHNIQMTGHVMSERPLQIQMRNVGEAMRFYPHMGIPGIDILCGYHEFITAKQTQSIVRQYGKEGMLSELFGVLGWDLDFRKQKHEGDWQAAMGVTYHVPHLSFYSMEGEAKRDYPQSIHYQSCWYDKYSFLEDHFARANTALTRGNAIAKIGVIHPIESVWMYFGKSESDRVNSERIAYGFEDLTQKLLFNNIDFDFISESLFPELCHKVENPIRVGKCAYNVLIVPESVTLRKTTLDRLLKFKNEGGIVLFVGQHPTYMDGVPSKKVEKVIAQCISCENVEETLPYLEPYRDVMLLEDGKQADHLLYQLRQDGDDQWLFFVNGVSPDKTLLPQKKKITVRIKGVHTLRLYDTMTGDIHALSTCVHDGVTETKLSMYEYDSFLIRITNGEDKTNIQNAEIEEKVVTPIEIPDTAPYYLEEPNVLLLDQAEYVLDDGEWGKKEEILRVDVACRQKLGWPIVDGKLAQPWCVPEEKSDHRVKLIFTIKSKANIKNVRLALERAHTVKITWNGEEVSSQKDGYFVDRFIPTVMLGNINKGTNILKLDCAFETRHSIEWCYLLGNFRVDIENGVPVINKAEKELAFESIVKQGLPFFGGKVTYKVPFTTKEDGTITVQIPKFNASVLGVCVDKEKEQSIAISPYLAKFNNIPAGEHVLKVSAYLNRTNTFGPVHFTNLNEKWLGPGIWRTEGEKWTYQYILREEGIFEKPIVSLEK